MVAPGTLPPQASRLERLALESDLTAGELRELLYRLIDEAYAALLAQVMREVEGSSLQGVESQPYK